MSGPPASQVVQAKGKRSRNKKQSGSPELATEGDASTTGTNPSSQAASSTPSPAATARSFHSPRQEHVYVDVGPVRDLYEQLQRSSRHHNNAGPSTSLNAGTGGRRNNNNAGNARQQTASKKHSLAFQSDFSDLPYPRGMVNNSNFCFMNSILQALLFIPPFAQLAVSVSCDPQASERCPTLCMLGKWVLQYWKPGYTRLSIVAPQLMPRLKAAGAAGATAGQAVRSQRALDGSSQEDAQEFLQKLLEVIQLELSGWEEGLRHDGDATSSPRMEQSDGRGGDGGAQKGWTVVKGKEKLAVREHLDTQGHSQLLSAIFGGTLESHLQGTQRQRDHVSVLVEKFFCVPVDIGFAQECTMEQALEHTFTAERIYDSEREKNLKKTLRFGRLPAILLLQLRRWAMTREGDLIKLDNVVHLKRSLLIPRSICADEGLSNAERTYRLLSVVSHRGDGVGRGHYVTFLAQHAASPDVVKVQSTGRGSEAEAVRAAPPGASVILCNDTSVSVTPAKNLDREAVYFLVYQKAS